MEIDNNRIALSAEEEARKRLGINIRKIREAKNMQQIELAYAINTDKGNLWKIENGKTNVTFRTIYKISKALDVDMMELYNFK